ncbi:MAG: NAD(P)H-dependent oxidoreductase subunit E [Gammaproteobacteria bacterium]|nr:NAD(P)H-dependent oxidoreductase subunit E [Gammaproteobacteria bacterium]
MSIEKPFYTRHIFFCENKTDSGDCCANFDSTKAREYVKDKVKTQGQHGPGMVRVNKSGCLGRCAEGPVAVVYPEGTWYTYVDHDDLDEIVAEHLVGGRVVKRLQLENT